MATALLILVGNWLADAALSSITHWTMGEALLQFATAFIQYFTCSLVSIRPEPEGVIDMEAFFEQQRRVILLAFTALGVVAMVVNFVDRNTSGVPPGAWISEDMQLLAVCLPLLLGLIFRSRLVQWAVMLITFATNAVFIIQFVTVG